MKIYCVNLLRAQRRRQFMEQQLKKLGLDFEFVQAVDGRELDEKKFAEVADMEAVRISPHWLTPGAIGCVLSHHLCYEKLMASGDKCALIIEDDVVLDRQLAQIIHAIEDRVIPGEVIMLYFQSFKNIALSSQSSTRIGSGRELLFPVNFEFIGSTGAYVITREAAMQIHDHTFPIHVAADSWGNFVKWGYVHTVRVCVPFSAQSALAESTIDYVNHKSWKGKLKQLIATTRLFPFYQLLRWRRWRNWQRTTMFTVTSQPSPLPANDRKT